MSQSPIQSIACILLMVNSHTPLIKKFDNIHPATEEGLGTVAEDGKEEVDMAFAAARRASATTFWILEGFLCQ